VGLGVASPGSGGCAGVQPATTTPPARIATTETMKLDITPSCCQGNARDAHEPLTRAAGTLGWRGQVQRAFPGVNVMQRQRVGFARWRSDVASGGNRYDDELAAGLRALGLDLCEYAVP